MVIITMIVAMAFDPRLIWDHWEQTDDSAEATEQATTEQAAAE